MRMPVHVAAGLALFGLMAAGVIAVQRPHAQTECAIFAHRDEWITHPDGRRVAQLAMDLSRYTPVSSALGYNYQEGERVPRSAEPIELYDWVRPRPLGGMQIHLENRGWQP